MGAGAAKRKHLSPKDKVSAVMGEYGRGTLHSGGGGIVKSRAQALAIALSEKNMFIVRDIKMQPPKANFKAIRIKARASL